MQKIRPHRVWRCRVYAGEGESSWLGDGGIPRPVWWRGPSAAVSRPLSPPQHTWSPPPRCPQLCSRSRNNHQAGLYLLSLRCFLWLALPLASLLPTSLEPPWVPLTPSSPKPRAATQVRESLTLFPFLHKGAPCHLLVTPERTGGLSGYPPPSGHC